MVMRRERREWRKSPPSGNRGWGTRRGRMGTLGKDCDLKCGAKGRVGRRMGRWVIVITPGEPRHYKGGEEFTAEGTEFTEGRNICGEGPSCRSSPQLFLAEGLGGFDFGGAVGGQGVCGCADDD